MTDTVLVRPRTGIILPGIPRTGASIPRALAEEWIADRLVMRLDPQGATKPSKQRSR
jgi:hypothetical protein